MGDEFDESQTGLEGSVVLVAIRIVHGQGGCPDAEAIEHGSNCAFHLRQRNAARHGIECHAGREFRIHGVHIDVKLDFRHALPQGVEPGSNVRLWFAVRPLHQVNLGTIEEFCFRSIQVAHTQVAHTQHAHTQKKSG